MKFFFYNSICLIITTGLTYNLTENSHKWNFQVENSFFDKTVKSSFFGN